MLKHLKFILTSFRSFLIRFFLSLYNFFRPTFRVEKKENYVIITLNSGFSESKILLPTRKKKIEKVFLCKQGRLIDITHPYNIDYFLTLEDLQGEYFLIKKNNLFLKVEDLRKIGND